MKYYIFLLLFLFVSCSGIDDNDEEKAESKPVAEIPADTIRPSVPVEPTDTLTEQQTQKLSIQEFYNKIVLPLYSDYTKSEFPKTFTIDSSDYSINAGAAFGHLEMSLGLVKSKDDTVKMYVIAHELGHIVTLEQAERLNLGDEIPAGKLYNSYKKSELIADLLSIYSMTTSDSSLVPALKRRESYLISLLGYGSFTHPSGKIRMEYMNKFYNKLSNQKPKDAMEEIFTEIWQMN